jgi:hypothetical protein
MQLPYGPDNDAIYSESGSSFRRMKLEPSPEYRRGEEHQCHQTEFHANAHKFSPPPPKSKSGPQKRMSLHMFLELVAASELLLGRSRTSMASGPQGMESSDPNDLHSSMSSINTDQFHSSLASLNAEYLHSSQGSLNSDQLHSSRNSLNIDQFHSSRGNSINNDHQQSSRNTSTSHLYSSRNTSEYSHSSRNSNNNAFHLSRSSLPQTAQRAPSSPRLPKSPQSRESPDARNISSEFSRASIGRMTPSTTPTRSSGRASPRPPREIIAPMPQRLVSPPMSPPFGNSGIRRSQSEEAGEGSPSNHNRSTNWRSSIGRTGSGQNRKLNAPMPQRLSTSPTPPMSPPFSGNSGLIRKSQSERAGEDSPHSRSMRPSIGRSRSGQTSQVTAHMPQRCSSPAFSVNSSSLTRSQSEQTREEQVPSDRYIGRTRSGHSVQSSQQPSIHSIGRSRSSMSSSEMVFAKDVRFPGPAGGDSGRYSTGTVSRHSGAPCGDGRLEFGAAGGSSYDGQCIHDVWSGYGHLVNQNGDSFEGYFVEGCKHGKGSTVYPDGRVFDGLFRMGEMVEGTMHYQDGGSYVGKFKNGKRHYQGTYNFKDGSVYHGDFRDDSLEGHGQLTWNNGAEYVGEWQNGLRHGLGREFRASGAIRYEGVWAHGKPFRQSCFKED